MTSPVEPASSNPAGRTRRSIIAMAAIMGGVAADSIMVSNARAWGDHHGGGGASCFLRGTRILTDRGDRPIEDLQIGDRVVTRDGRSKPIRWVARRRYVRQPSTRWPQDIAPVRIARGAFAPDLPHADLFIAGAHALYYDGALINVEDLVNGTTVALDSAGERLELEYFHIHLAEHDVILAEGVECETLALGDFEKFDNFVEYERLYGRPPVGEFVACAPLLAFDGRRSMLLSRLRSAVSPVVDRRTQLDRLRDLIEERATA
jgi:hypothetical protein